MEYNHQQVKAVITVSAITIAVMMTATIYGLGKAYATNPNIVKQEFDINVKNIKHSDIIVSLTIDGENQKFTIDGNPHRIGAPTAQIIKFTFPRNNGATPPTPLPLKLGDEYTYCISFTNSQSSCQRATLSSITQPESKTLDAKFIP